MEHDVTYQDVFKTNTPELDQNVSQHAEYLLMLAQNQDLQHSEVSVNLRSRIHTSEVTQAIWELKDESNRPQRILAITVMGLYYRIGIDRRPTPEHPRPVRFSVGGAWMTGPTQHPESSSENEAHEETAYDVFYETVAALGLRSTLVEKFGTQNESNSATFASAA